MCTEKSREREKKIQLICGGRLRLKCDSVPALLFKCTCQNMENRLKEKCPIKSYQIKPWMEEEETLKLNI